MEKCSAYVEQGRQCRNGFPTTPVCWGSTKSSVTPHCCREEWCGLWFEPWGGKPPEKKSS